MKKRWIAALLALLLTAALAPATAQAAQTDRSAGARLSGIDRTIYDILVEEAAQISEGSHASTTVRIPDQEALSWTLEELGMPGGRGENVLATLSTKFDSAVNMSRILTALSMDYPHLMYWADNQYSWGYSSVRQGDKASIRSLTVYFQAAQSYRSGGDPTVVSASKVSAAKKAEQTAQAIVEKYRDSSDYEKLTAYREEICRLTSYDLDAYQNPPPYGDTWQMIYVFDGDPGTNVVCEGYAKAFKYLCDLSDFDSDITCYIVSGKMDGGNHMWNVVRMGDGQNYLVDVTNCDTDMMGADDKLFLCGGTSTSGGMTCTVDKGGHCRGVYTYNSEHEGLYTNGYLTISASDYDPNAAGTANPPQDDPPAEPTGSGGRASFTDVIPGAYYADSVAWAVEQEITDGTTSTTFSPGLPCTHGQILTFLWRAAGKPAPSGAAPSGVARDDFFFDAVCWAAGRGMLGEDFSPRAGCSRADAVRYIWCAFDQPSTEQKAAFTDVPSGAAYAQAVDWALEKGVTTGATDTTFGPDAICSRGQIATFLYRAYHETT